MGDWGARGCSGAGDAADVQTAQPEWAVQPEDVAELLKSQARTWTDEARLLTGEQTKRFPEMETVGEDAVKTAEMTKDLNHWTNLGDKAAAGFERIDFSFEGSSNVGKMLSSSILCYREIVQKRKSKSSHFKKSPQPPEPSEQPDQPATANVEARLSTSKKITPPWRLTSLNITFSIFSHKVL